MKRNLIICVLIVTCVVAGMVTIGQAQAKSVNTVFKIATFIHQDKTTGTFYFAPSHPACIPLTYKQASVTIKNEAKAGVNAYSFGYLKPGQNVTLTIAINRKLYDTMFTLEQTSPTAKLGFVDIMTCGVLG